MMSSRIGLAAACALAACGAAQGDFSGPYAPENWSFDPGPGGFIFSFTADRLVLVGAYERLFGQTDLTIVAVASGTWSFDWFYSTDTGGFDDAYYLVNGVETLITPLDFDKGTVRVSVAAGDVIGFRIDHVDPIHGPGFLHITNFTAPVPGPGAIAVVLPLMVAAHRRRRRASCESRSSP